MCCFSGPVETVGNTSIFARRDGDGRQVLVYGMSYAAGAELAMVLPLPVAQGSGEGAVRFVSLEGYPAFFVDLHELFAEKRDYSDLSARRDDEAPAPRLPVHDVGHFEASFVPQPRDFARLDERFRMAPGFWEALPQYADYGFAVFKLKPATRPEAAHPMALAFPSREPEALFFPTVHVHDGEVHAAAQFDHSLYVQFAAFPKGMRVIVEQPHGPLLMWADSRRTPAEVMNLDNAGGLIEPDLRVFRLRLEGRFENRDTWVGAGSRIPQRV